MVERLDKIHKMGSSDYSSAARPYVVNLDVVGPLSDYVQVGFSRLEWNVTGSIIEYLVGISGGS